MNNFQTIELSIDQAIARLTLNRPDAANGMNLLMAQEILQAVNVCEQQSDLRVLLISANGKMFSAGGDVKSFANAGENIVTEIRQIMHHLHAAVAQLAQLPCPVVIAVNGMAAGAGFSLACGGDIVLAAESAQFTMAYTAIGLSPDVGASWYLPRLVGQRRAQELMLTNRRLSATEACDWGIVTRVVGDDVLVEETEKLISHFAKGPTRAFAAVKKLLHDSSSNGLETQLELEAQNMAKLANSIDGRAGINGFINKQKVDFIGQ